jgi:hypothetical protein
MKYFPQRLASVQIKEYTVIYKIIVLEVLNMDFLTTKQAAKLWGISPRRVALLCSQGRITGVMKAGKTWLLPPDAQKPADPRFESREDK